MEHTQAEDEQEKYEKILKNMESWYTEQVQIDQITKEVEEIYQQFGGEDDVLKDFKEIIQQLFETLIKDFRSEAAQIQKCKDFCQQIIQTFEKIDNISKTIVSINENYEATKFELQDKHKRIEEDSDKTHQLKQEVGKVKQDIAEEQKAFDFKRQQYEQAEEEHLRNLQKDKEELEKTFEIVIQRYNYLRKDDESQTRDLEIDKKKNEELRNKVQQLKEDIEKINQETEANEILKQNKENEMDEAKNNTNLAKNDQKKLDDEIKNCLKEIQEIDDMYIELEKRKKETKSRIKQLQNENDRDMKKVKSNQEQVKKYQDDIEELNEECNKCKGDVKLLEKQKEKHQRENKMYFVKVQQIIDEKDEAEAQKRHTQDILDEIKIEHDKLLNQVQILKEETSKEQRELQTNEKNLKRTQDEKFKQDEENIAEQNKLKKIENQNLGYEAENNKLKQKINLLQKEQEKYGIEASQAHAKYYQTIEEVKIKNNQINELQKKNLEVEGKKKHQQGLYEAVRSDKNKYSKNLMDSKNEIAELQKKNKFFNHQIEKYKDELKQKDAELIKNDVDYHQIQEENTRTKAKQDRIKDQIKANEFLIKTQEIQNTRLKGLISKSKAEKQVQEKDLDKVNKEKDILCNQLIKKRDERSQLYQKNQLLQSNLGKSDQYFRNTTKDLKLLENELHSLAKELMATEQQTAPIQPLKQEITSLEKEIRDAQNICKTLSDELKSKLNVHRWRKLEATDTEAFDKIVNIQTLQRRLIAKTEEVEQKDSLIKEKEKLFMELKNILSRQPGPEIHNQLESYKNSLKEKSGQMKKMLGELKQSQDSVDLLKYENNRLRNVIQECKKSYFSKRQYEDRDNNQGQQQVQPEVNYNYQQQSQQENNFVLGGSKIQQQ